MLFFENDYAVGCCPEILERLARENLSPRPGYGADDLCARAAARIAEACRAPEATVRFVCGGTQANALVIGTMLSPYEGVVCCASGHIATHEAGAIEFGGHKVLTLPQQDGKLRAEDLRALLTAFTQDPTREHTVYPGMVYLSHPTELGTLYTAAELRAISEAAHEGGLSLFVDGARLAYGLACPSAEVDLPLLAELCDAFTIGGTKCGALFGEAIVFPRQAPSHFTTRTKQHGALLAKGFALGLQFDTLFTGGLYLALGRHALEQAMRLRAGLLARGERLFADSPTNQQFLLLEDARLAALAQAVRMSVWAKPDPGHTAVRLATSWATLPGEVDALLDLL